MFFDGNFMKQVNQLILDHLPAIMKEGDEPFCAKCLKAFKKRIKGLIKQEDDKNLSV